MAVQDTFRLMMREHVASALRQLGFRGSGQLFYLPSDTTWALLGFQKSTLNNSEEMQFTMNLSAGSKAAWAEARVGREHWIPERPTPNTRYGAPLWERRIGMVLPERRDRWWRLSAQTEMAALADEIVTDVRDFALPALLERIAQDGQYESVGIGGGTVVE